MPAFTKREKIVASILLLLGLLIFLFPQMLDPDYEMLYLLFIVVPLGALIATDKERINKINNKE